MHFAGEFRPYTPGDTLSGCRGIHSELSCLYLAWNLFLILFFSSASKTYFLSMSHKQATTKRAMFSVQSAPWDSFGISWFSIALTYGAAKVWNIPKPLEAKKATLFLCEFLLVNDKWHVSAFSAVNFGGYYIDYSGSEMLYKRIKRHRNYSLYLF